MNRNEAPSPDDDQMISEAISNDYTELGANLREGLAQLERSLPEQLKYPSRLEEAQRLIYHEVLAMLLGSGVPMDLTDPVRDFLASFHQVLAHRSQVETWQHNQYWFACAFDAGSPAAGPCGSEEEALEKLYEIHPELR